MSKKIYFSPSDQMRNTYAVGNTTEAIQCRQIALYAVEAAKRCGFEALTNVTDNGDDAMDKRIQESNAWGADAHIPIHTNAFNGSVAGTRMFCYDGSGEGYKICKAIMDTLSPITPGESDNITAKHYDEVLYANAPTAYLEIGFHDNSAEAQWIIDHKQEIAEAIVQGLCNYYGVSYVAPATSQSVQPPSPTASQPEQPSTPASSGKLYRVQDVAGKQVGAYRVEANAFAEVKRQLEAAGKATITLIDG